jgi:hypothetical protein
MLNQHPCVADYKIAAMIVARCAEAALRRYDYQAHYQLRKAAAHFTACIRDLERLRNLDFTRQPREDFGD